MRQGQKNNRSRGRPNNNRKPQSGRTFDSNGPDVKIRGTAAHIYEKYQSLARDAQTSGDRIVAENYLQHAEHYYRVMLASEGPTTGFQNRVGPMQPPSGQPGANGQHGDGDDGDEQATNAGPNGQPRYNHDQHSQQPNVPSRVSDNAEQRDHPREHNHGNGQSNGRSGSAHTEEPVVVKPNVVAPEPPVAAGPSGDGNAASADAGQAPAREAGDNREQQPRRRGRPPRDREDVSAAPAAEGEAGSETPETAS
jgi:Domain of unknown function (DUF4167)